MFDFVRKHTKIMMGLLFLLIIPSFVLFGIDGYNRFREKGETVARVSGHDITQAEWDATHKMEVDRLRASMPSLDPKLLDSPQARYATLERLVRERVLAQAADRLKLVTSDARLARDLQENPTIASLRRADGTLDMERYRQLAGSQGMTPEMFEARVRSDLSTRQVEAGVNLTGLVMPSLADIALNAFYERREVQLAPFTTSDFAGRVNPTEAELEAYYLANQALFQAPEQADIEYVVLDLNAVKKTIIIPEQDLKSYYDQIKVTDIKAPKQKSFEELRAGIEADLKNQQAQRKFAETAEAFTNGVYEQSDSLKPIADRLKLDVQSASNVLRKPAAGATGVLANPKFLGALFGPDAVEKKRNTEAVETAPNQLTAGRITQHTPARALPLADVRNTVRERVVAARGAELAKKEGLDKLAAWRANPAAAALMPAVVVSRDKPQNVPPPVLDAVLRADTSALPSIVGVDLGAQGYAVVKVNKIVAREAAVEAAAKQDRAQYAQWWTGAENQAYYKLLQERFKAQIKVARPALSAAESAAAGTQ